MKIAPNNITSLTELINTRKSCENEKKNIVEIMLNKEDEEDEKESSNNARAVKAMKRKIKMEKIAAKVARGRGIGVDEENYLLQHNSGLLYKARMINSERKELVEKIRLAKTKEEADSLVLMYREKGILLSLSNNNIEEPNIGKVVISTADKVDESTLSKRKEKEKKEKEFKEKKLGKIDSLV